MRLRHSKSIFRAFVTFIVVMTAQWFMSMLGYRVRHVSKWVHDQHIPDANEASFIPSNVVSYRKSDADGADWLPQISVTAVNCSKLFADNSFEMAKARLYEKMHNRTVIADADYVGVDTNCEDFRKQRGYIMGHQTEDERTFPIAFSILMHAQVEQTERLLRAIYRPQNFYCIHVDRNARRAVKAAIDSISACFDNVFVTSRRVHIVRPNSGLLEANLHCMEDLLAYKPWKYFINLTARDFPLKTNGDLVRILRAYDGANDVMGISYSAQTTNMRKRYEKSARQPPPFNIVPVTGRMHVTLSRAFVDFLFENEAALQFRDWVIDTPFPEESYIQTLNFNQHLGAPGAFLGDPDTLNPPHLSRHEIWFYNNRSVTICHGKPHKAMCVFGVRDLPYLPMRKELFLYRVELETQPLTYACLEERHFTRTWDEYSGRVFFDSGYYAQTQFAKKHAPSWK